MLRTLKKTGWELPTSDLVTFCWFIGRWLANRPCESRRNFQRMHSDRKSQFSTSAAMGTIALRGFCIKTQTWRKGTKRKGTRFTRPRCFFNGRKRKNNNLRFVREFHFFV